MLKKSLPAKNSLLSLKVYLLSNNSARRLFLIPSSSPENSSPIRDPVQERNRSHMFQGHGWITM